MGRAVILVKMYVKIIKTDVISFIGNIIVSPDVTLTEIFLYQSQFVNTDNITQWGQRKNVHITDKMFSFTLEQGVL
jgi:hypothetical protein